MGAQNSAPANGLPALSALLHFLLVTVRTPRPEKKCCHMGKSSTKCRAAGRPMVTPPGPGFRAGHMKRFSAHGQQVEAGAVIVDTASS